MRVRSPLPAPYKSGSWSVVSEPFGPQGYREFTRLKSAPQICPGITAESRARKMPRSGKAYVRGNTAIFYEWLAELLLAREIPMGPPIWICGDCHLGNLGPLADADHQIAIQ